MIRIEDVSVDLAGTPVLENVSCRVSEGELLGLIGPNGAGKTTLLRTISGLISPKSGTVHVGGAPVAELGARELGRRVAVVPQETDLSFDFTVREVVAMGRTPYTTRLQGRDERAGEAVDRALARTETAGLADRHVTAISGGERKRVTIARAIAQETPALLLDEPTASLDINHELETFELVSSLVERGKGGIAAIHDLTLAARYCDRLLLLDDGETAAIGTPEAVLSADRLEQVYGVDVAVQRNPITGTPEVTTLPAQATDRGAHVHVIGGGGASASVIRTLVAGDYQLSLGVIEEGTREHRLGEALGATTITVPRAAPIDEDTHRRHCELIDNATVTVVAAFPLAPTTRKNLRAASRATRPIIVDEPTRRRNYLGEDAASRYHSLCQAGKIASCDALREVVAAEVSRRAEESPPIANREL